MRQLKALGSRVLVEDIVTSLSIEQRALNAGFVAIINEVNRPKSTQGRVVAIGTDPLLQEEVKVGDIITFGYLSGTRIYVEGKEYRSLEFHEIITVEGER